MTSTSALPQLSARRLEGKTAIITGGASGIGLASVRRFAAEGANVVSVDLDADAAAASVDGLGDQGLAVPTDVTDSAAVAELIETTIARFGDLDVYFNNAGVPQHVSDLENITDEEWDRNVAVNLSAIFYAARAVVPHFKARGGGVFLITASMSGIRPRPKLAAYTAAKGGAVNMTKALAIELAEHQIRVNAVCPVSTDTPMLQGFGPGDHGTAKATPLGRLASPEENAATAAWLASDDASFITGSTIMVDGGRGI